MARKRATDLSKTDMTMLVLIVLLVIFGLAVLFSSSEYNGRVRFGDSACYFKKQLFATALGMGVMYMVSSIDYHFFLRLGPVAYLISMFLSGAVLFVGQEINGSKRWLNLGPLSFQPSEFAKVAVILFLAWQIERTKKATMGFGFMCRTILTLLPIIGLVGSNNLSTAIIILGIGGILIFVSNPGYLEFIGLGSAGAGFIAVFLAAESYRLERLAIWRNPEKYEKGFPIAGLEEFKKHDGYYCFHAGTKFDGENIVTNGGRVLGVTAKGADLKEARANAYAATEWIQFENKYKRNDIGKAIDEA